MGTEAQMLGKKIEPVWPFLDSLVLAYFSWYTNKSIILDWYHLHKKCKELLSMALNGRDNRNAVLQNLMPLLWHGLVDQAIACLKNLSEAEIKNEDERMHLVQYLAKNRPMIPVYAVRRELGLRNSSNRGEKANDLLVAERQKHNGMSWSPSGSVALASVTALKHNREYHKWFRERKIVFRACRVIGLLKIKGLWVFGKSETAIRF
jgi:hypothetical protein